MNLNHFSITLLHDPPLPTGAAGGVHAAVDAHQHASQSDQGQSVRSQWGRQDHCGRLSQVWLLWQLLQESTPHLIILDD